MDKTAKPWTPQAIPTLYNGIQLKSRLEADTAFLLDGIKCTWEYEPCSFLLPNGNHYQPDFWLPEQRAWVECRGYSTLEGEQQIAGFKQWIWQERIGPDMQRKVDWSWYDPATASEEDEERLLTCGEEAAVYLVIRGSGISEFYLPYEMPSCIGGLIPCEHCGSWTIGGARNNQKCRLCRCSLDAYNSPLSLALAGRKGVLMLCDPVGEIAARHWFKAWPGRQKQLDGQKVARCMWVACPGSAIVDESGEPPGSWIFLREPIEGRPEYVFTPCFCSRECAAQHLLSEVSFVSSDPKYGETMEQIAKLINAQYWG
ncbi:MAG TPA: hypothetical protein VKT82_30950 [Ktedonobacterales bacterium]|nr:hypothetical protein [Ktedonobacterales bacterium]